MLETMPDYLWNELIKLDICIYASFMWFMWIAEFLKRKYSIK